MTDGIRTISRPVAIALGAAAWFGAPVVVARYFFVELARDSYPVNADSIGIPIGELTLLWGIATPVAIWVARAAVRSAPRSALWWSWDRERVIASIVWSVVFLGGVAFAAMAVADGVATQHAATVAEGVLTGLASLALRAMACAPRRPWRLVPANEPLQSTAR